jgi:hypothetical protein
MGAPYLPLAVMTLTGALTGLAILVAAAALITWVATRYTEYILQLDRRVIYTIVALLVVIPLIKPFSLPIKPTPETRGIYDYIDHLKAGSNVVIAADFDPASKPELLPILKAALAHCFARGIKPHVLTLWPSGPGLAQQAVDEMATKFNKKSGEDYVFLGFRYGTVAVILGMVSSIPDTFTTDYYTKPTRGMPIYEDVTSLKDFDYILDIAAGATVEYWMVYGAEKTGVPMGAACTAVSATGYYPILQAGQITGLSGGMKGSAEYEVMLRSEYGEKYDIPVGAATKGMDAQSAVHVFIVLSIIVANLCYFISLRREDEERRKA